ncbi:hypothetical protein OOJ09_30950 [Mesorhizobium qingshengii]|uniref:Uncharacterized protein n=1 Tax=Mesorhizobium qingshengii TaxID=1165689 RepID=A0ABT4R454_9HYPH|nr:hypothetical protein [Mesorhizobium qingshengii]MCZ8548600.1 hypothetical protein [Mesorhizobium qingshengii]
MQNNAAELLAELGNCIKSIQAHLATMDDAQLEDLLASLPSKSTAGSAEMVMLIHLYRDIENRKRGSNVLAFPARKARPTPAT